MGIDVKGKIEEAKRSKGLLEKPTIFDRFFEKTVLKVIPCFVRPNHLTVFRYLTTPFILYFMFYEYHVAALVLFCVSALSDALDGAIARTRGMVTNWGKINDPLADKLLIGAVGAFLVTKYIDVALIVAIIAIEIMIVGFAAYRNRKNKKIASALLPGKIKMILQSFALVFLLLYPVISFSFVLVAAEVLLYGAIFLALISLFIYKSI